MHCSCLDKRIPTMEMQGPEASSLDEPITAALLILLGNKYLQSEEYRAHLPSSALYESSCFIINTILTPNGTSFN